MEFILYVFLYILWFSILIMFMNAIFGTLGILLEPILTILYGIIYSIYQLFRMITGRKKRSHATKSFYLDPESDPVRSIKTHRSISRSIIKPRRSTWTSTRRTGKWTKWKKKTKKGDDITVNIRTSILRLWEQFVDIFREKE